MNRVEEFNKYISDLMDYWEGKNDDFVPMPIPKEVDDEMQKDSFYQAVKIRRYNVARQRPEGSKPLIQRVAHRRKGGGSYGKEFRRFN